jgi:hypothetical protein
MSVVFSGTNQGTFVSDGNAINLSIRSDVDWMWVYNYTQMATQQTTGRVVQSYWQRGMASGTGVKYTKTNSTDALNGNVYSANGFTLFNSTINLPGASHALTSISNATPPRVLVGSTAGLSSGQVVRIFNTAGAQQLGGFDFTITVVDGTHFDLAYMRSIVAAAGPGSYRVIPYNPYFYPPVRVISKISQATQAIVTLTVDHNFTVGQVIRFVLPTVTSVAFGMTELNQVQATIVAVGEADVDGVTNTITVDIDTSGFTAFAWPLTANPAFTAPQVVPVGMNSAAAIEFGSDFIGDSEVNIGAIGMTLGAGAQAPAGSDGDVIYWVAGKSYNGV